MSTKRIINVHDIIKKYSLPIYRKDQSIIDCLGKCFKDFYLDLKEIVANDYPDDFPTEFYDDLISKNMPIISKECAMILDILKLDSQGSQAAKFIYHSHFVNVLRMGDLVSPIIRVYTYHSIRA